MTVAATKFRMILLKGKSFPIFDMLKIEESIMRCDPSKENVYIFTNEGNTSGSVVMGSSGNVDKLVYTEQSHRDNIPIIKRFSGGGTVLVDHNTVFVSIIGSHKFLKHMSFDPDLSHKISERENDDSLQYKAYPEEIMNWSYGFYKPVFSHPSLNFQLRENDYIFHGGKKFGGNAQYITGGKSQRWVHHTSFLWDMNREMMEKYLKMPEKKPQYRSSRSHSDFLITLKESFSKCDETIKEPSDFTNLVHDRVLNLTKNEWRDNVSEVVELSSFEDVAHFVKENPMIRTQMVEKEEILKILERNESMQVSN